MRDGDKVIEGSAREGGAGVTPSWDVRKKKKIAAIIPVNKDKPVTISIVDFTSIILFFIALNLVYGKICL